MTRLYYFFHYALLLMLSSLSFADEIGSPYLEQAKQGDRRAQYYLADTYISAGDVKQAEFWAQKSADLGDADALSLLAQIKLRNPTATNVKQARILAEKAVLAGSLSGNVTLARLLVNTQAGTTDYPRAISLLESTAHNEESDSAVDAQMLLGLIYANESKTPEDDAKAAFYLKQSSVLSRTGYAEYWAGMLFLQGEDGFIKQNKQKALQWLNRSCLEGFDTGCEVFDQLSQP